MNAPANPHAKDAEAAGQYVRDWLIPRKSYMQNCPADVIADVARWAGHWGRLALKEDE